MLLLLSGTRNRRDIIQVFIFRAFVVIKQLRPNLLLDVYSDV
jgi:hypothetical protein